MKFWNSMLSLSFIFLNGCSINENDIDLSQKNELENLLIGSWYIHQTDPNYPDGNAISTYMADGTVIYTGYSDIHCQQLAVQTKARWQIKNGDLYITVESSTDLLHHPKGLTVADKVINIDKNNKTLSSIPSQRLQYRTKDNTCLSNSI